MKKLNLKRIRKQKGFSQEQMADFLHMDTSSYHRRENGKTKITQDEWHKIAAVLQVPLEKIFEPELIKMDDANLGLSKSDMQNCFVPFLLWEKQRKYIEKLEKEALELNKLVNAKAFDKNTTWSDDLLNFQDGNVTLPISLWKNQLEYIKKLEKEITELKKKSHNS